MTNDTDYHWVNYRVDKKNLDLTIDDVADILESETNDAIYGIADDKILLSVPEILIEGNIIDKFQITTKYINIPFLTNEQIINIIESLRLTECYTREQLDIDKLLNKVNEKYTFSFHDKEELGFDYKGNRILGKITFNPNKIFISQYLDIDEDICRKRFTIVHEIGHLILHSGRVGKYLNDNIDTEEMFSFSDKTIQRLEIQANIFAGTLLIPYGYLKRHFDNFRKMEWIGQEYLYLDNQPINIQTVNRYLEDARLYFKASKAAIKYQLIGLGLLKVKDIGLSACRFAHIGNIFKFGL